MDDVARSRGGSADLVVARAVVDADAAAQVARGHRAVRRDPDVVARRCCRSHARVEDRDAVAEVEEAMLRSAAVVPPRIVFVADQRRMPSPPFATALVPAAFVPVRLPRTTFAFGMALDAKPVKIEIPCSVFPGRVARAGRDAADRVVQAALDRDPVDVGDPGRSCGVRAGVVALNRVVARVQQEDAVAGVSGDPLRAAAVVPPIMFPVAPGIDPIPPWIRMPSPTLPRSVAPSAARPITFPWTTLFDVLSSIPLLALPDTTFPAPAAVPPICVPSALRASGCRRGSESPRCRRGWSHRLPRTTLLSDWAKVISMPLPDGKPEMRFPWPAPGPPIVLPGALSITMPIPPGAAPSAAVPRDSCRCGCPGRRCRCWRRRGSRGCAR